MYGAIIGDLAGSIYEYSQTKEIKKLGATVRMKLLNYLETRDVYELANTDELSEDLKEKLKEGKKIEMLLRQEKFDPLSNEEIIERFEDFAE